MRLGQYLTLVNTALVWLLVVLTLFAATLVSYRFVELRFRARLVREATSISGQMTEFLGVIPLPSLTLGNLFFLAEPDSFVRVLIYDEERQLQTVATSMRVTSILPCNLLEQNYRDTLTQWAEAVILADIRTASRQPEQFTFEAEFCYSQPDPDSTATRSYYTCAQCRPEAVWIALVPVHAPESVAASEAQSSQPRVIGFIEVIQSTGFLEEVQARLWAIFWASSLGCFLVVILATYTVSRFFTSPLSRITQSISSIQSTAEATTPLSVHNVRGIQEVLELAEAFQGMQRRLGGNLKSKQDMASNLSHELRNALGALELDIETLDHRLKRQVEDPVTVETLEDMRQNVSEMLDMSNRTLAALYSETSSIDLKPERVEVGPLLEEVVSALQATARRKQVHLHVEPLEERCAVVVDRTYFKNDVLLEIVVNAVNYTQSGGEVVVGSNQAAQWVRIYIEDTGPGIDPEYHESIFDPYFRVDQTANPGRNNWGLGLSLARGLVRQLGGNIHVFSRPGTGSTFSIVLPAVSAEEDSASA